MIGAIPQMAIYGFRIHTLEPHLARKRTDDSILQIDDVSKAGGETDAFDEFVSQLLSLKDAKTQVGTPTYYIDQAHEDARLQSNEEAENLPYFEVLEVEQVGRRLNILVETGREADHDALVDRTGKHEPIKRKAAVRKSTVIVTFPTTGDMAVMVSEVRGRGYAGDLLIMWLTRRAQRAAVTINGQGVKKEDPWLNWKMTPRIDGDRLDGILNESENHGFKLRRRSINSRGGRHSYDIELVQWGLKKIPIEKLLTLLSSMADRVGKGSEADRRKAAANDVISLIEPDVGGVEFDDAEVTFLERGKTQTVNSETIDQLYVYPLGTDKPKGSEIRKHAGPVVERIGPMLGIEVHL